MRSDFMIPALLGLTSIALGLACLIRPRIVSAINSAVRSKVMGWVDPLARKPVPLWGYRVLGAISLLLGFMFLFIAWAVQIAGAPVHG